MAKQQFNVSIDENLKHALDQKSKREGRTLTAIVEEWIQQDATRTQGEVLERQSLPLVRETIREEVRKANAELYIKLYDAMLREIRDALKENMALGNTRLAKLITRTVRDSGIIRRLVYAFLSKTHGKVFAAKVYERAEQQTLKELSERIPSLPQSLVEEQEVE
jgi:predicted DNA-binding protein